MKKVPIDVVKTYIVRSLYPRCIAHLSAVSKRFLCLQALVHPDYKKDVNTALQQACCEGYRALAEWLIDVKGAWHFNLALNGAIYDWWSPSVSRVVD